MRRKSIFYCFCPTLWTLPPLLPLSCLYVHPVCSMPSSVRPGGNLDEGVVFGLVRVISQYLKSFERMILSLCVWYFRPRRSWSVGGVFFKLLDLIMRHSKGGFPVACSFLWLLGFFRREVRILDKRFLLEDSPQFECGICVLKFFLGDFGNCWSGYHILNFILSIFFPWWLLRIV